MQRWTIQLEGGPRRVNHAAVVANDRIYTFGGYCTGEDYETTRPMDVHVLNTGNYESTFYFNMPNILQGYKGFISSKSPMIMVIFSFYRHLV